MKMKTSPNDVSNQRILEELSKLSNKMDAGFEALEKSDHEILEVLQGHSSETDARFILVESRLTRVEARMVTKDYLDDKLADQYSKIVEHTDKRIEKALS
jgi:hypothetical protein